MSIMQKLFNWDIFPHANFTLETKKTVPECVELLQEYTRDPEFFAWREVKRGHKFDGYISDDGFELEPALIYAFSFMPLFQGSFTTTMHNTTRVRLKMRMHKSAVRFSYLWFLFLLAAYLADKVAPDYITGYVPAPRQVFWPVVLAFVLIFAFYFNLACRNGKAFLRDLEHLLEGEVKEVAGGPKFKPKQQMVVR